MLIYLITNKINGKKYVGLTARTLEERWLEHVASRNKARRWRVHDAIRKYGPDNFEMVIIEECSPEVAIDREAHWIAHHNSFRFGYNLNPGGRGVLAHTEETKAKLSRAAKRLWEQGRLRQTAAFKGKKHSSKTKLAISTSLKESGGPWRGKKLSEEHKEKDRLAILGTKRDKRFLRSYLIEHPCGKQELVVGIADFCKTHNISVGNLTH